MPEPSAKRSVTRVQVGLEIQQRRVRVVRAEWVGFSEWRCFYRLPAAFAVSDSEASRSMVRSTESWTASHSLFLTIVRRRVCC